MKNKEVKTGLVEQCNLMKNNNEEDLGEELSKLVKRRNAMFAMAMEGRVKMSQYLAFEKQVSMAISEKEKEYWDKHGLKFKMETKEIKINVPDNVEEWVDIKGYEGVYQVSNFGRIRSLDRYVKTKIRHNNCAKRKGKILKTIPHHNGYLFVSLSKKNKPKLYAVHRLVAEAFIPNNDNKPQIDHINTITSDNNVNNLRWVTASENSQNSITKQRRKEANIGDKNPQYGKIRSLEEKIKRSRPVLQFTKEGDFIKEFAAIFLAAEEVNVSSTNIITACKNFNKTSGEYKWKYKTEK